MWRGDEACAHVWGELIHGHSQSGSLNGSTLDGAKPGMERRPVWQSAFCQICHAWKGSLGNEPTVDLYVAHIVEIFAEVWRVLRDDGLLFLNLGDSYYSTAPGTRNAPVPKGSSLHPEQWANVRPLIPPGLKPKDLCGVPWRCAFALQDAGWYLRSDTIEEVELYCPCGCGHVMDERIWRYSQDREVIWHKPNVLPESVRDRPTRAHEYMFLLTKRPTYYYDADAIREPCSPTSHGGPHRVPGWKNTSLGQGNGNLGQWTAEQKALGRNKRSVWTIPTHPFAQAHFATMPPALVEPCVLAGTSERGCCPRCGAPWERVVCSSNPSKVANVGEDLSGGAAITANPQTSKGLHRNGGGVYSSRQALGWRPTCTHYPRTGEWPILPPQERDEPDAVYAARIAPQQQLRYELLALWSPMQAEPCTVLDPFAGAGTTLLVADRHGRDAIGIELNPDYVAMAQARCREDAPLFVELGEEHAG